MNIVIAGNSVEKIGFETENERTQVRFDLSNLMSEFPGGYATLAVKRPCDNRTILPSDIAMDGTTLVWTVGAYEVENRGILKAQAIYSANGVVAKTKVYKFQVDESVKTPGETPPSEWQDWLNELSEAAANVHQEIDEAEDLLDEKIRQAEATVLHYPRIINNIWYVWDSNNEEYVSTEVIATGHDGVSPVVSVEEISGGHRVIITDNEGDHSFDVLDGASGGSAEKLVAHFIVDENNNTTSDKTIAEIAAADKEGKIIEGYVSIPFEMPGAYICLNATYCGVSFSIPEEGDIPFMASFRVDCGEIEMYVTGMAPVSRTGETEDAWSTKSFQTLKTNLVDIDDPKSNYVFNALGLGLTNLKDPEASTDAANKGYVDSVASAKINASEKGSANGVAELDQNGRVPSNQLPSYVDDVVEYNSLNDFPVTGESGKIYVAKNTNVTYRWSGSTYVVIGTDLTLGETSSTAYRGDRGKAAYDAAVVNPDAVPTANSDNLVKSGGVYSAIDEKCENIVVVSDTQPTDEDTKIWFPETASTPIQVPTYAEHQALASSVASKTEKFIVNFTVDENDNVTSDKTITEIATAYTSGNIIEGIVTMPFEGASYTVPTTYYGVSLANNGAQINIPIFMADGEVELAITGQQEGNTDSWFFDATYTLRRSSRFPNFNALGNRITSLGQPVSTNDATTKAYVDNALSSKYEKPSTGIPASDLASGVIPDVPVTDVQVNGASVVQNGVANVPIVDGGTPGVVKTNSFYGISTTNGFLTVLGATDDQMKTAANTNRVIIPLNQHKSVFYGLAKAAGDATQSASSNAVGTYTTEAKAAIKTMLGIQDGLEVVRLI